MRDAVKPYERRNFIANAGERSHFTTQSYDQAGPQMTPGSERGSGRIVYRRAGFESPAGHQVRTTLESSVCDWLMENSVAHRHASEVFMVKTGPTHVPTIYVPDIILHDRDAQGRLIIIEAVHSYSPKKGGMRLLAAFREEMKGKCYLIIVAKKHYMKKILKDAYDIMIDFGSLDELKRAIPIPPNL